ncbi:NAD-dependent DNA ligase LigA [Candidatus Sumerlaeota bacterium]|nr:NAD-dependent DNA ligase LigA [Candidatus Sumerlaeota bacterium]
MANMDKSKQPEQLSLFDEVVDGAGAPKPTTNPEAEKHAAEVVRLRAEIAHHDQIYYSEGRNEIEDYEYDKLVRELRTEEDKLKKKDPNHELLTIASPLNQVGGGAVDRTGETVRHAQRMLSIDNTYNEDELLDFDNRVREALSSAGELAEASTPVDYVVELKLDGIAVSVMYEHAQLRYAATRGNGEDGEIITGSLSRSPNVPNKLSDAFAAFDVLELRGEAFLTFDDFNRINNSLDQLNKKPAANPRNLAAGTLKRLDEFNSASRRISVRFYAVGAASGDALPETHSELLSMFAAGGLPVNDTYRLCHGINEVIEFEREWEHKRHELPYPVDGLVVKVNRRAWWDILGTTAKSPRYMIAYKFNTMRASTELLAVTWQVGRTGILTPVAELAPVQLAGTTVKRATLHNYDEICRLGVRVGDDVLVEKSGEIIPKILRVSEDYVRTGKETEIAIPASCPECGGAVVLSEGDASPYCQNENCEGRKRAQFTHFASRAAMDIQGLDEASVRLAMNGGILNDIADIYYWTEAQWTDLLRRRASDANVKGAEKKEYKLAKIMVDEVEESKAAPLHRVLFALGIPQVGATTARDLARTFGSLENLMATTTEDLEKVDGVGSVTARGVVDYFADEAHRKTIDRMRAAGVRFENTLITIVAGDDPKANENNPFIGRTLVLTGTLSSMKRDEAKNRLEALGATVSGSVSAKTWAVVAGPDAVGTTKLKTAAAKGVQIIQEEEFLRLLAAAEDPIA